MSCAIKVDDILNSNVEIKTQLIKHKYFYNQYNTDITFN